MADSLNPLLAAIWRKNLPLLQARVELLDQIAEQVAITQRLSEPLRTDGLAIAHKLAGSLGMFGYMRGTAIAQELELLLGHPEPDRVRLVQLAAQLRAELFPKPR